MNKSKRQLIFFISIFVVMFTGVYLLRWSTFQCLLILCMFATVMKLTDIEDIIEGNNHGNNQSTNKRT